MKNKKTKIGISFVILLFLLFIGYKVFLLYYYHHNDKEYREMYTKITDLAIQRDITTQNDKIGNLHYDLPNEFSLEEEKNNQKIYIEYNAQGNQISRFTIGKANINSLEETKQSLKFVNYEKLAKKYDIKDEIDLYHYYYEHKDEKRNIFWNRSHIQMNGFVNLYMLLVSTGNSNCNRYFLTQDMKGYMVNCSNSHSYNAYFTHENNLYEVSYMGKEETSLTDQEFIKILKSISFK